VPHVILCVVVFAHQVSEYSALEGDADIDDDPVIEEVDNQDDQDEEPSEEEQKKRKPWGDSKHFCPVALKEQGKDHCSSSDYYICLPIYVPVQKFYGLEIKIMLYAIVKDYTISHLKKLRMSLLIIPLPI